MPHIFMIYISKMAINLSFTFSDPQVQVHKFSSADSLHLLYTGPDSHQGHSSFVEIQLLCLYVCNTTQLQNWDWLPSSGSYIYIYSSQHARTDTLLKIKIPPLNSSAALGSKHANINKYCDSQHWLSKCPTVTDQQQEVFQELATLYLLYRRQSNYNEACTLYSLLSQTKLWFQSHTSKLWPLL